MGACATSVSKISMRKDRIKIHARHDREEGGADAMHFLSLSPWNEDRGIGELKLGDWHS